MRLQRGGAALELSLRGKTGGPAVGGRDGNVAGLSILVTFNSRDLLTLRVLIIRKDDPVSSQQKNDQNGNHINFNCLLVLL